MSVLGFTEILEAIFQGEADMISISRNELTIFTPGYDPWTWMSGPLATWQ